MIRHKRSVVSPAVVLRLAAILAVPMSVAGATAGGPDPPRVTEVQQAFLSRLARRTLTDALQDRGEHRPRYTPRALEEVEAEVVVRVWQDGFLLATGLGRRGPIAEATGGAARAAAERLKAGAHDAAALRRMAVEIEAAGEPEPFEVNGDWTRPGGLGRRVEPGIHGLVLIGTAGSKQAPPAGQSAARRVYPSEFIRADLPMHEALAGLARVMHMTPADLEQTRLQRFRAAHWVEPPAGQPVLSLVRGLVLVSPDEVRPDRLREAADDVAEYMLYRQLDSGLFTYRFDAGADRYSEADNLLGQAGAAFAVSFHARATDRSASQAAARAAVRYHLQGLTEIEGATEAAFIASADGENKLGLTALVCLALTAYPEAERFEPTRRKLINGLLWIQRPSGMFLTAFPPAVRIDAQDYFPGEALLALAAAYEQAPSDDIVTAFDRAHAFYCDYFRKQPSPAFVPWQVQAFARMATATKRDDFVDYVFELADWSAERQLDAANCPWPELRGGVVEGPDARPGASTGLHLQAFADALALARTVGDTDRVRRYERAVRAAARFVLQLQVRAPEAFLFRSPQDAVRGIREAPALNRLRIDHSQHALIGLLKAREALNPDGR